MNGSDGFFKIIKFLEHQGYPMVVHKNSNLRLVMGPIKDVDCRLLGDYGFLNKNQLLNLANKKKLIWYASAYKSGLQFCFHEQYDDLALHVLMKFSQSLTVL